MKTVLTMMMVLTALLAALLGFATARRRGDLALDERGTALASGALGLGAGMALAATGARYDFFLLFAALAPLAVIDARRMVLPDDLALPLIALGPLLGLLIWGDGWARLAGATLGFLSLHLLMRFWPEGAMGRGDAKLFAALGGFFGWSALPEIAFLGALGGIAFALIRHGREAHARPIPFGPALIGAALLCAACGPFWS
ncbi:MAG: prepilin peptidase [Pikeienuella sp.]